MADWTDISDTRLEPGKPIRSIEALALRDNITAAFEGAAGAPALQAAAIGVVAASSLDADIFLRKDEAQENTGQLYVTAATFFMGQAGSVNVTLTQASANAGAKARIYKNGVQQNEFTNSGTYSADVTVAVGDYIEVKFAHTNGVSTNEISNIRIRATNVITAWGVL